MIYKNEFGDIINVTDEIKVTLNTTEMKYNYSFWTSLRLAKRWVKDFRGKCKWEKVDINWHELKPNEP